jgi:RNA polymerase sigma factor (sigma-70 family)
MRRTGPGVAPIAGPGAGSSDDQLLIERALDGAADAYDQLFRRHRDGVARTAYLFLRDAEQAQDAAQEAFLIGWRDLRRLRDPERFRAWVTGIALNLCRRSRRAIARDRRRSAGLEEVPTSVDAAEQVALRIEVRRAVDALPRPMREAIVLRFYCGFAESEIAVALRIPVGTVKSRLGRARARLAETLRTAVEVDR